MSGLVLVFGESLNDARAIAELIIALCPELTGKVKPSPRPTSLTRTAHIDKVSKWAAAVADVVNAFRARGKPVQCVFVHRDADQQDPAAMLARATEEALTAAGVQHAHAVVPIESIESWWLCFPQAVETFVPGWSGALRNPPGDVDRVATPKGELIRRTRAALPKRPYGEADSHGIARQVRLLGIVRTPHGKSDSYSRFVRVVDGCCSHQKLVPGSGG